MSSDSWVSDPEKQDVGIEDMMVEGCGFREGRRLGTHGGKTEEEGDIGGEWRDNFLVGMMELFKNSELGLDR